MGKKQNLPEASKTYVTNITTLETLLHLKSKCLKK